MNPNFFSSPRAFWALAAGSSLLVLGVSLVALTALRYVGAHAGVLKGARSDLARLERERSEAATSVTALKALRREIEVIRGSFADPGDPLPLIEAIEDLAQRSGLKVEISIAPGEAGARGESYAVSTSGPFRSVAAFFRNLEALPFLVDFGNATLAAAGGTADSSSQPSSGAAVRLDLTLDIVKP